MLGNLTSRPPSPPERIPMTIESPCTRVCVLDHGSGLCIGCGRSGEEIGSWSSASPSERRAIMAELPVRLARLADRHMQFDAAPAEG